MNAPKQSVDNRTFERRARALYREAAQHIEPAMAGRLRAARRTALEALAKPARPHGARMLLPSGALAAIALALLLAWSPLQNRSSETLQAQMSVAGVIDTADGELPPDPDSADPGMVQNLDFYGWLATNNTNNASQANR
ncbi:MAG TPA: hypothetical protein VIM98_02335 [Dyella sp.]|uniref:hypothetical protein n=1 Tax=Dyella sp. TaxID=1869338 RepID=UPI002F9510A6